LLQQALSFAYDFVVVGDCLRVRRMKRNRATIEKVAACFGTAADDFLTHQQ
jgi:hypothetical protein